MSGNPLGHTVTSLMPPVMNLKRLVRLWIYNIGSSKKDLKYVRDTVQQALPELDLHDDHSDSYDYDDDGDDDDGDDDDDNG